MTGIRRQVRVIDPNLHRTSTGYDPASRVTLTLDGRNQATTTQFNRASQRIAMIDPLNRQTSYRYDTGGRPKSTIDPRSQRVTNILDLASQVLVQQLTVGGRITSSYDPVGNRLSMLDAIGLTRRYYERNDRVLGELQPTGQRLSYAYDPVGRRILLRDPSGNRTTYSYDLAGQLRSVANPQGQTNLVYDPAGRKKATQPPNNTPTTLVYDVAGRRTGQVTSGPGGLQVRMTYLYDVCNRRTRIQDQSGTYTTYSYDPAGQLTREQRSGFSGFDIKYRYDAGGNRTSKIPGSGARTTYIYDSANELTHQQSGFVIITYRYDLAGNRLLTGMPGTTNKWDSLGRMMTSEPITGPVTYVYDGDGRRLAKISGSGTTSFVYDFEKVLQEDDGSTTTQYTSTAEQYGTLLSAFDGSNTSYYVPDALGDTAGLISDTGSMTDSYAYQAFGLATQLTGSNAQPFTWVGGQGYQKDSETSFYFVRARYYDPAHGQWISRDPLGLAGGDANLYRYCANDPVNKNDPRGMDSIKEVGGDVCWVTEQSIAGQGTPVPWVIGKMDKGDVRLTSALGGRLIALDTLEEHAVKSKYGSLPEASQNIVVQEEIRRVPEDYNELVKRALQETKAETKRKMEEMRVNELKDQATQETNRLNEAGQLAFPRFLASPEGSVQTASSKMDDRVLRDLTQPGGKFEGAKAFSWTATGAQEIPIDRYNRATDEELDAATMARFMQLMAEEGEKDPRRLFSQLRLLITLGELVPVIGTVFSAANLAIAVTEGDWVNASLSALAMIPLLGELATTEKIANKGAVAFDATGKIVASNALRSISKAEQIEETSRRAKTVVAAAVESGKITRKQAIVETEKILAQLGAKDTNAEKIVDEALELTKSAEQTEIKRIADRLKEAKPRETPSGPPKDTPNKPELPQAEADVRGVRRFNPNVPEHVSAARAEEQLAQTVHRLPDEVVVRWGDPIGAHGADVISVNQQTGAVTFWDAKFRSGNVAIQPSPTFAPNSSRLQGTIDEAIATIRNNQSLPANIRQTALRNLQQGNVTTRTVGFGNAKNSTLR